MRDPKEKIVSLEELKTILSQLKAAGKRIAFTNGCFDLLHVGHTRYLRQAREMADVLIVALNTDGSVQALKGAGRPIQPQEDRAEIIASLESVDYVLLFEEQNAVALLDALQPDLYVKGGDYTVANLPEAETVTAYGGYLVILPFEEGRSTTRLIERIKGDEGADSS